MTVEQLRTDGQKSEPMTKLLKQFITQARPPIEITNNRSKTVENIEAITRRNYTYLRRSGLSHTEAANICYGHPQHTTGTFTSTKEEPWN